MRCVGVSRGWMSSPGECCSKNGSTTVVKPQVAWEMPTGEQSDGIVTHQKRHGGDGDNPQPLTSLTGYWSFTMCSSSPCLKLCPLVFYISKNTSGKGLKRKLELQVNLDRIESSISHDRRGNWSPERSSGYPIESCGTSDPSGFSVTLNSLHIEFSTLPPSH